MSKIEVNHLLLKSQELLDAQRHGDALLVLQQVEAIDPDNLIALNNLAMLEKQQGRIMKTLNAALQFGANNA